MQNGYPRKRKGYVNLPDMGIHATIHDGMKKLPIKECFTELDKRACPRLRELALWTEEVRKAEFTQPRANLLLRLVITDFIFRALIW